MRRWTQIALWGSLALLLGGCALRGGVSLTPDMQRLWPVPPDMARVAYLHEIHVPADAGVTESAWQRLVGVVAGRQPVPQIESPVGIYADVSGRVLVADAGLQVVHLMNIQDGTYAQAFRLPEGRLASPVGVAFDAERGWVFVADSILNRIFIYTLKGLYVGAFGDGLRRPAGLAWDAQNRRLIAADTGNHRVVVFDAEGRQIQVIGERGSGPGEFNFPTHVAVDGAGRMWVTDTLNFRVQVFDSAGAIETQLGGLGRVLGRFSKPKGVAVDADGRVFVVDSIFDVVQLFDADGQLLMHFGGSGSEPGQFWLPAGIAVAGRDIFVADTQNRRVQIFRLLNTDPPQAEPGGI